MAAQRKIKPVGGIESVAVVPAGTAAAGSPQEIAAQAEELPLVEDASYYEERTEWLDGIPRTEHRLSVTLPRDEAQRIFTPQAVEWWATAGTAAVVRTASGERLVVGWSERFGGEQPLRLVSIASTTARSPREVPTATALFRSFDTSGAISNYQ